MCPGARDAPHAVCARRAASLLGAPTGCRNRTYDGVYGVPVRESCTVRDGADARAGSSKRQGRAVHQACANLRPRAHYRLERGQVSGGDDRHLCKPQSSFYNYSGARAEKNLYYKARPRAPRRARDVRPSWLDSGLRSCSFHAGAAGRPRRRSPALPRTAATGRNARLG